MYATLFCLLPFTLASQDSTMLLDFVSF